MYPRISHAPWSNVHTKGHVLFIAEVQSVFPKRNFFQASYGTSLYKISLENTWFKKEGKKNPKKLFAFALWTSLGCLESIYPVQKLKMNKNWKQTTKQPPQPPQNQKSPPKKPRKIPPQTKKYPPKKTQEKKKETNTNNPPSPNP